MAVVEQWWVMREREGCIKQNIRTADVTLDVWCINIFIKAQFWSKTSSGMGPDRRTENTVQIKWRNENPPTSPFITFCLWLWILIWWNKPHHNRANKDFRLQSQPRGTGAYEKLMVWTRTRQMSVTQNPLVFFLVVNVRSDAASVSERSQIKPDESFLPPLFLSPSTSGAVRASCTWSSPSLMAVMCSARTALPSPPSPRSSTTTPHTSCRSEELSTCPCCILS